MYIELPTDRPSTPCVDVSELYMLVLFFHAASGKKNISEAGYCGHVRSCIEFLNQA